MAPGPDGGGGVGSRLGADLGFDSFNLARPNALLFEHRGAGPALSRPGIDWLALTAREAYELCVEHEPADRDGDGADG